MAVATTLTPLPTAGAWVSLGAAAPLMLQAIGGPVHIFITSGSAPATGVSGIILHPEALPYNTFTSTGTVYAMSPVGGASIIWANAS